MGLIHGRDRRWQVQIANQDDDVACVRIGLGQAEAPNLKRLFEAPTVEKGFILRASMRSPRDGVGYCRCTGVLHQVGGRLGRTYTPRHGSKDR